jgi:hypothetical protein
MLLFKYALVDNLMRFAEASVMSQLEFNSLVRVQRQFLLSQCGVRSFGRLSTNAAWLPVADCFT